MGKITFNRIVDRDLPIFYVRLDFKSNFFHASWLYGKSLISKPWFGSECCRTVLRRPVAVVEGKLSRSVRSKKRKLFEQWPVKKSPEVRVPVTTSYEGLQALLRWRLLISSYFWLRNCIFVRDVTALPYFVHLFLIQIDFSINTVLVKTVLHQVAELVIHF